MSRARHHTKHKKARGGSVYYEGGESNVAKEAAEKEQKKHGGRVHGKKAHHRLDKRARGGKVKEAVHKHEHHMHPGEKETKLAHGGHIKFHHIEKREHQSKKDREHERKGEKRMARGGSEAHPMAPESARHPFSSAAR